MRRCFGLVLLYLLWLAASGAMADPFRAGRPAETAAMSGPAPASGVVATIATWQRTLNEAIARHFRDFGESGSPAALAGVLALAFAFGAVHAAGPGHSKAVVASYLLARPTAWRQGIMLGSLVSLTQGVVAIVLVSVLGLAFQVGGFDIMAKATVIEAVSYGLIVLVGLWMLQRAVRGHDCHGHNHGPHHDHGPGPDRSALGLVVSAGLTPCASAIIVLLFALANGVYLVGILAAIAMSLGMAATLSAVGLVSISGRRLAAAAVAGRLRLGALVDRGLHLGGALLVIGFASVLLLGAWARL
jgi:ABC-type nickel/cobalt efflux system permease component RcnA